MRVQFKSTTEIIIKRQPGILGELMAEFSLKPWVNFELSAVDTQTQVKKKWLEVTEKKEVGL